MRNGSNKTGILLALAVMSLSVFATGCVTIAGNRMFSTQNDLKNLKYEQIDGGWIAENGDYRMIFKSIPSTFAANQNVEFRIELYDKKQNKLIPMDDAAIECTSLMPDTPGYLRVLALNKQYPGTTPGICSLLPLNFDTPGKWIVIYSIQLKTGENFRIDFPVTVNEPRK